jgi:hypothetical protein
LRNGKSQPPDGSGHTAEELADIRERTVRRDEIVEREYREIKRLTHEFGLVLAERDPEERKRLDELVEEIERAAKENGPDSKAWRRYQHLRIMGWFAHQHHLQQRRRKERLPRHLPLVMLPPADAFPPPPSPGETVTAIPPKGSGAGPARLFARVRPDGSASLGTAERGYESLRIILEMPDGNHLFHTTEGMGYIIDVDSRTLVEDIGSDVITASRDKDLTLFFVYHGDGSVEGFGKSGRLWRTRSLGTGEFRNMSLQNNVFAAEVRQTSGEGWVGFSVDVATGEVRVAEGE